MSSQNLFLKNYRDEIKLSKEGRVFQVLVDFADFLPTLADVAGIEQASSFSDGKSFANVLTGENSRPGKEEIFIHYSRRY